MEKRINSKQFIDMDELSCPWESGNKLVTPINDAKQSKYESIIEIIKNAKYEYNNENEKGLKLIKKNE